MGNTVWWVGKNDRQLVSKSAELEGTSTGHLFVTPLLSDVKICQVIDKLLWKSSQASVLASKNYNSPQDVFWLWPIIPNSFL